MESHILLPTLGVLNEISFRTTLGRSLKQISIKDFTLSEYLNDIDAYRVVARSSALHLGLINSRFKSNDSISRKYTKSLSNGLGFMQCFNDIFGMRLYSEKYPDCFPQHYRIVDLRHGKRTDDGYRAIHLYYQRDNYSYPIEIQLWCGQDYQFNSWSHMFAYKYTEPLMGRLLRESYDAGEISTAEEFRLILQKIKGGIQ